LEDIELRKLFTICKKKRKGAHNTLPNPNLKMILELEKITKLQNFMRNFKWARNLQSRASRSFTAK
jgi:hypothetical protein